MGSRRAFLIALPLLALGCAAVQRPDGGTGLLPEGSPVPDLSGADQTNGTVKLKDERGRFVVVFFYPLDGSPGCTQEACSFRDVWSKYEKAGVSVFGVSTDDVKSHEKFAKDNKLPFPIIADDDGVWGKAFGVMRRPWPLGYERVTFVLTPDGKVGKVYENVDPGVHAATVLADIANAKK